MRSELDGWRVCPRCGSPLEPRPGCVSCGSCGLVHYAKPAPAICAIVEDGDGRILLGRRAHDPEAGRWDVLGGFMEEGEQPLETLARELLEETGLEIEAARFLGALADTYGDAGGHTLNLCWTARVVSGELAPADDVAEARWFSLRDLPRPEEFAFANGAEFVRLWRRRSIDELLAEARRSLRRLTPVEAWEASRNGGVIVDVRSEDERRRQAAVIPGAVHHPLSVVHWRFDPAVETSNPKLPLDAHVILVCREGYSSSLAAAKLREIGFERATDVDGGVDRWRADGLPLDEYPPT